MDVGTLGEWQEWWLAKGGRNMENIVSKWMKSIVARFVSCRSFQSTLLLNHYMCSSCYWHPHTMLIMDNHGVFLAIWSMQNSSLPTTCQVFSLSNVGSSTLFNFDSSVFSDWSNQFSTLSSVDIDFIDFIWSTLFANVVSFMGKIVSVIILSKGCG